MSRQDIEKFFPNILDYGYTITSPETVAYNCIAWAAGVLQHGGGLTININTTGLLKFPEKNQ